MKPVLTAAETRALDVETEARGTSVETLMERAGHAVARTAASLAGATYGSRAVVVCGKGNNGGDGLVAARWLTRWGMGVDVFLLAEPGAVGEPASTNLHALTAMGVPVGPYSPGRVERALGRADVAVDAIFGIGFRGRAEGRYLDAIRVLNGTDRMIAVVAVDIPSGVEGDTGAVRGPAVMADVTVTFGAPKVGVVLFPGAAHAGVVDVADIGFPRDLLPGDLELVEDRDARDWLGREERFETDKRAAGVVLVLAGSRTMTGAPVLVAEGAYRAGAGLVTVAVPEGTLPVVQAGLREATFLPLAEGATGSVAEDAWTTLASRIPSFDAVALGPGLSTDPGTQALVRRLVRESPRPQVVDADAINAFAGRAGELSRRAAAIVLTPHVREFGRLFGVPAEDVVEDRVGLARKGAAETGCVLLLKGSRTVIAPPDGPTRITATGSPVLATGGTGDVLTGAIAALLARGLPPLDAAAVGAHVHGMAGRIAGERTGEGTIAGDVARALPEAIRRLRETA
jgi:ADP-dependent NAD(P)H-hydrate dehydratase / NAD(P)H-hydrate epimerase